MLFRFGAPLATNPRMENLFERTFLCRAGKYYGPKFLSIQVPIACENLRAKFSANLIFNFRVKVRELLRGLIGIKESGAGNIVAQRLAKACLSLRNAAINPK